MDRYTISLGSDTTFDLVDEAISKPFSEIHQARADVGLDISVHVDILASQRYCQSAAQGLIDMRPLPIRKQYSALAIS